MASVTYRAPEGDDRNVKMCGVEFVDGQPVEVDDAAAVARFKANRFFDVADIEIEASEAVEAPKRRGRPPKVADAAEPASDSMEGGE